MSGLTFSGLVWHYMPTASLWTPQALSPSIFLAGGNYQNGTGTWTDSSANGRHATQGTSGKRPGHYTINSLITPDFDGTDDELANGTAISSLIGSGSYCGGIAMIAKSIDAGSTAGITGTPYGNDGVAVDSGGYVGAYLANISSTPTFQWYHFAGGSDGTEHTITLNTPFVVGFRYDGTNLRTSHNGGTPVQKARSPVSTLTGTLKLGTGWSSVNFSDVRILDFWLKDGNAGSDQIIQNDYRLYVNATYALSL